MSLADAPYPRPWAPPAEVQRYFSSNARAARVSAAGQLLSAGCAALFTASVARLARQSAGGSRRLDAAAITGGAVAAASLATSAACSAALSGPWGRREASAATLHKLAFTAGGPVHGVGFGLLVAALGIAGRRSGRLPEPWATTALVSAAAGLLSPLYFVARPAGWLIPAGRFPGLLVSGVAGVRLAGGT